MMKLLLLLMLSTFSFIYILKRRGKLDTDRLSNYFSRKKSDKKTISFWVDAFNRLKKNRVSLISLYFLIALSVLSIVVPIISTHSYRDMNMDFQYRFLDWESIKAGYYLGTDDFGRDLLVRIAQGGRISLLIAIAAVFIEGIMGVLYGSIAGYFGGKVDFFMIRIIEMISAVPNLLYIILLMIIMGPSIYTIILAMGISRWMIMAMIVRSEVIRIKNQEFVMASKSLGAGPFWILVKHLIPNAIGQIIVRLTFGIPVAIFYEAFLSFMGIGVPLPMASWGRMVSEGFRQLHLAPHLFIVPALFISLTILAFNLIGDALRDALDPKLRR